MKKTKTYNLSLILLLLLPFLTLNAITSKSVKVGVITKKCKFVDLSPDSRLPAPGYITGMPDYDSVLVDFEGDGKPEVSLKHYYTMGNRFSKNEYTIKCLRPEVLLILSDSINPRVFSYGEKIKKSHEFGYGNYTLIDEGRDVNHETQKMFDWRRGDWYDLDNKYIGVKFFHQNEWFLGWIKIGFQNNNFNLIVYEYCSVKI